MIFVVPHCSEDFFACSSLEGTWNGEGEVH